MCESDIRPAKNLSLPSESSIADTPARWGPLNLSSLPQYTPKIMEDFEILSGSKFARFALFSIPCFLSVDVD